MKQIPYGTDHLGIVKITSLMLTQTGAKTVRIYQNKPKHEYILLVTWLLSQAFYYNTSVVKFNDFRSQKMSMIKKILLSGDGLGMKK